MGRSRGGFTTKIPVTVDGLVNPLRLRLTAGQASDIGQEVGLVDRLAFNRLIADMGYDAQDSYDWVVEQEMEPVIPPHRRVNFDKVERPYVRAVSGTPFDRVLYQ